MKYPALYFENSFPKTRPFLDPKIKQIYDSQYLENREGKSPMSNIAQKLESWMHIQTSKAILKKSRLLEIGAGTLNHLNYQQNYALYDVVEPYKRLIESSGKKEMINKIYEDIFEVTNEYDCIFSIATLEHLTDLPRVVSKAATLLSKDGTFLAAIPSEGGFLWGTSWRVSTGVEFYIKHRLNYGNLMRYEHLNNYSEIESFLRLIFKKVDKKYLGIGGHLSLYQFFECSQPKLNECKNFLVS
jgi:SAM-dependent methyltransferase